MKKKILAFGVALSVMLGMVGCSTVHTVNHNLSKDANEFNIYRRITVTNARTDTVMLQAEGYMALGNNSSNELVVTIKTGDDQYYKYENPFAGGKWLEPWLPGGVSSGFCKEAFKKFYKKAGGV